MPHLALVRHGQSQWNLENRFTGWVDVDISETGRQEARSAGRLLDETGLKFDLAFTSVLKRAIRTLWIVLDGMDLMWIPQMSSWKLNERHYGALQGLDKTATAERHGAEQVHIWRRSFDVPPPPLAIDDPGHPRFDPKYSGVPVAELPSAESLKETLGRVLPYWEQEMAPHLREGRAVLCAAHGNSLRALIKHLFSINDQDISSLEIPTGTPLLIELTQGLEVRDYRYLDPSRSAPFPGQG